MFPQNPSKGDTYKSWTWNGCKWVCEGGGGGGTPQEGTFIGPNPPASTYPGQLWLNSTTNVLSIYNGTAWVPVGPGSGNVTVSATAPTNPLIGDFWFNTGNDFLYIFDGVSWAMSSADALTIVSSTQPTNPVAGLLWHDTSTGVLWVYDGTTSAWILAHPLSTTAGANPPAAPSPGDFWFDTANSTMYIYDGSSWVASVTTLPPVSAINYVGPTAPASPTIGELWFDTANNEMFIYDGAVWQPAGGIAGAQGVPGNAGSVGPQGPAGPPGPNVLPPGVTDGSNAALGQIGEYVIWTVTGIPVVVNQTTTTTITVGTLQPGDWQCFASLDDFAFSPGNMFNLSPQPAGFSTNMAGININMAAGIPPPVEVLQANTIVAITARASLTVATPVNFAVTTNYPAGNVQTPQTATFVFQARRMR